MGTRIYSPPEIIDVSEPGVFLAGPIQGAPNWQQEAQTTLAVATKQEIQEVAVFNPRVLEWGGHTKEQQIIWEKHYLEHARKNGAVLFWFAAQDLSVEDYPVGRAYAQTSRIEFGRVMGWRDYDSSVRVAVGIDREYMGGNSDYIRSCAQEHGISVHHDLAKLCIEATALVIRPVQS